MAWLWIFARKSTVMLVRDGLGVNLPRIECSLGKRVSLQEIW